MLNLIPMLLPFAIDIIKKYVASSDSKKDDKVLEIAQETCKYMASKDNNTLSIDTASSIALAKMKEIL